MEGNVLFDDAFITFYLRLYEIGHLLKVHSDKQIGKTLPPFYVLLFPLGSRQDSTYHGLVLKDPSDSERKNLLPPFHGLLFPISNKGLFIMHHPTDKIAHTMALS